MALFAASDDFIKARLRLTNVPASSPDTLAIIDEAIASTRLEVYDRLGRDRVAELVAIAEVAVPDTVDELNRTRASLVEVKMVRVRLLRELPNAFMDASGDVDKRWNEEAPFRERPRSDREREIARLLDEIEEDMQMLAEEESVGDETGVMTFDTTLSEAAPLPGDTILRPGSTRLAAED